MTLFDAESTCFFIIFFNSHIKGCVELHNRVEYEHFLLLNRLFLFIISLMTQFLGFIIIHEQIYCQWAKQNLSLDDVRHGQGFVRRAPTITKDA